jgi:cysteinyl-tRNA synthetase
LIEGKKVDENESGYTLEALARRGYSGRLIRYWLISTHYRKPITFSEDRLNEARQSLKRIDQCVFTLQNIKGGQPYPDLDQLLYDIKNGVTRAMDDDLNISAALAVLFSNIKKINILALERKINTAGAARILDAFRRIDAVLGFLEFSQAVDDPEVRRLIKARDQARSERNWEAADKLRNQLQSRGIMVQDRKLEGTL